MTITEAPRTETIAPPAPLGWTGTYKACKDCGTGERPEVEDGLCTTCYADRFGPAARRLAEARRDSRRPAAPVEESPARRWHPEFDACLDCGGTDRPYGSRGLCTACYPASLRPGYAGNAAPPKKPGGRGVSTPRPASPPVLTRALPRDETSVEAIELTVERHAARLHAKPTPLSAPLPVNQVQEVRTGPLPEVEPVAEPQPIDWTGRPVSAATITEDPPAPASRVEATAQAASFRVYFSIVSDKFKAAETPLAFPVSAVGASTFSSLDQAEALAQVLNDLVLPQSRARLALTLAALFEG